MVNGITFSEQLITSANFAHFMYTFLNHANGITKGCEISQSGGIVYIQKGYFLEFGRMVQIIGTEEIQSPDVVSGQLYCKVIFEIDLSKTNSTTEFKQGIFKTLTNANKYPELVQEDLDNDGMLYQMPWCQYIKKVDGISQFRDLREILNIQSIWDAVSDQNQTYKEEFDQYFASQKVSIEQMIEDLKGKGFASAAEVTKLHTRRTITLKRDAWSGTYPFEQIVGTDGITSKDTIKVIGAYHAKNNSEQANKAIDKAAGLLMFNESGCQDGKITFRAKKKPDIDFTIITEGA